MDKTGNTNADYVNYMTNQPMRDGEEISSFFDEMKKEGIFNSLTTEQRNKIVEADLKMKKEEIFNSLTVEERDKITEADLKMEEARKIKAMCNHRHIDKNADSIIYDKNTNTCKCTVCGAEFTPIDANIDLETIRSDAKKILNYLHTTKILYPDMPSDEAHRIYSVIPIIEDLDKIFDKCVRNFGKQVYHDISTINMNTVNMMNCLNTPFQTEEVKSNNNHNMGEFAMMDSLNKFFQE